MELNYEAILSQYANSPKIITLLEGFEKSINPQNNIQEFYDKIINILSAEDLGLEWWGDRLGVSRNLKLTLPDGETTWALDNEQYRFLLLVKAMANVSDCTNPSLNRILNRLFQDRGHVFVIETGTKQINYVFQFYLEDFEKAILQLEGIPPKPTGVGLGIYEIPPTQIFGFNGSNLQTFNNGTFSMGKTIVRQE